MPYRDELSALTQELEQKRAALAATRARLGSVRSEETGLTSEVAELAAKVDRARRRLEVLHAVDVQTPCHEPWESMTGDERVRFCGRCDKHVYNLSGMTRIEAEQFVSGATGSVCIRFFRRPDGTLLTEDCPVGVRGRRIRRARNLLVGGLALGGVGTVGFGLLGVATMGEMRPIHAGAVGRAEDTLSSRTAMARAAASPGPTAAASPSTSASASASPSGAASARPDRPTPAAPGRGSTDEQPR